MKMNWGVVVFTLLLITLSLAQTPVQSAKHAKVKPPESDAPEDVTEYYSDGVIRFGQGDNPREYILQCLESADTTIKGAPVDGAIVVSCGHK